MQSLKLADGDLIFSGDELVMISGPEELAQCVRLTLGTNRNEWFLDLDMGIDFSTFLGKYPNAEAMREELRAGIFQEPRVLTVDGVEILADTRTRKQALSFVATAEDGIVISEEVEVGA